MTSGFGTGTVVGLCMAFVVGVTPTTATAQVSCATSERASGASTTRWQPPLDRVVSIHERGVALRDALDRLAAAAGLRLAYAAELLPLDRRVCVSHRSIAAGSALMELLEGVSVQPVVTDSDRVVLAPSRPQSSASADVSVPDQARRRAGVLERVVVTGSVNGSAQRAVPVALDVVDGREMERRDARTLSSILDGSVPGIWVWEQSPTSLLARYASIRGASSFGISYPKVYVDGIEVANSLLVTELNGQWLPREDIGVQLRSFWREYPGVNRLRASASYDLRRTLSFVISAENLLDHQLGEPDNVTVLPG